MKLSIATASEVAHVFSVLLVETSPEGDIHIEATPDMFGTLSDERAALLAACLDRMPSWDAEAESPWSAPRFTLLTWMYQDSMWETVPRIRAGEANPV